MMSGECDECGEHAVDCECLTCTDFNLSSSKHGLKHDQFYHLDPEDKKKLVRLIARVSERSYRRGVQQALELSGREHVLENILSNLHGYRYENDLDTSPGIDGYNTTSIYRLSCEENLHVIGLEI